MLKDGDEVKLGGTTLVAHRTAGHTKACTTWMLRVQNGGKTYNVVIVGSMSVLSGYLLVNSREYPEIADDYVRSFKALRSMPVDVFLGAHGSWYGLVEKYARLEKGGPNPFIDSDGLRAYLDRQEKNFNAKLKEQKRAATK